MFNNRFDFFHGRVHLISLVATFLSMFWPWIVADDTINRFEILGIQTILSNIFMGLLILNILVSTLRHNKLVSIFNIMIGILCFIIVLMTFIGYYLPVSATFGVIRFGVGIYIALIGTIGIVVSGFLSLAKNKK